MLVIKEIKRENHLLKVSLDNVVDYTIKVLSGGKEVDVKEYAITSQGIEIQTTLPAYEIRINTAKTKYIYFERNYCFQHIPNFRDMGGYQSKYGGYVTLHHLYRSGQLYGAISKEMDYLEDIELETIIDYRGSKEIAKAPDPKRIIKNYYNLSPKVEMAAKASEDVKVDANSKKQLYKSTVEMLKDERYHDEIRKLPIFMEEMYQKFLIDDTCISTYREMFEIVLNTDGKILQHCKGGKDRTGYGSALLLLALGVSKEDVMADFMLSNTTMDTINQMKIAEYSKVSTDKELLSCLEAIIKVKQEYIDIVFTSLEDKGGIERYLYDYLGLSKSNLKCLRNKYLIK